MLNDLTAYLVIAVLLGCGWRYYVARGRAGAVRAPRLGSGGAVIHPNLVVETSAPLDLVRSSLIIGLSGVTRMRAASAQRIVCQRINGFTATITFQQLEPNRLRAITSIDTWTAAGATGRAAADHEIKCFLDAVIRAFQAVDPMVQLSR